MKRLISYAVCCLCIPAALVLGATVFREQRVAYLILAVAVLSCVPFFLSFERGRANTSRMVLVAVMTALSIVSRVLFAMLPGFKPVAALVIVTGMYFGCEAGFLNGAMTAVLSNFYFGQGAWTPIQMLTWGLIGFGAGLLARPLKKHKVLLCGYGVLSGAVFSLLMDVWSVFWWEGSFRLSRYLAMVASSAGFTVTYMVSNLVFLLFIALLLTPTLERIKRKYEL